MKWFLLMLLALASVVCRADILLEVRISAEKRAAALNNRTLVWEVTYSEVPTVLPAEQQARREQTYRSTYENVLSRLLAQNRPREEAEREARQAAAAFASAIEPRPVQFTSDYWVTRRDENICVEGDAPVLSPASTGVCRSEITYSEGIALEFNPRVEVGGRIYDATHYRLGDPIPSARIWRTEGHAIYYRGVNLPLDLTPEVLTLVAAGDPTRMYGAQWSMIGQQAISVSLLAHVSRGNAAPFRVRVNLDRTKDLAPRGVEVSYVGRQGAESYTVREWKLFQGVWIPMLVEETQKNDAVVRKRLWKLKNIVAARECSTSRIPQDFPVRDLRLLGDYATDDDLVRKTNLVVSYGWNGRVPTLQELQDRQKQQALQDSGMQRDRHVVWRIIPPLLLITIGVLWYWRVRQGERKT
jgi:hypothetical protein